MFNWLKCLSLTSYVWRPNFPTKDSLSMGLCPWCMAFGGSGVYGVWGMMSGSSRFTISTFERKVTVQIIIH